MCPEVGSCQSLGSRKEVSCSFSFFFLRAQVCSFGCVGVSVDFFSFLWFILFLSFGGIDYFLINVELTGNVVLERK